MTTKTLNRLPNDIDGRKFKTDEGVKFEVHAGDYFADRSIGRQHRKYLGGLRTGLLVSVSFYGQPVPLVTVDGGVVKLEKVEVSGKQLEGAAEISKKLGLTETRQPIGLDIEGDIGIAKEFLNSPQNRLHKFYAITKGGGEEHFRKFLLEHGDEYAESYFDMGTRGFQANTARVVGTLIDRFIAEKGSPENLTILDIASGPEMLKTHIDDSYKPNVVSLDLNPRFFEGEGENRIIGSMVSLPVREKSVDYANISLALHYSEFKPRRREYQQLEILSEMNRVLKIGGRGTISLLYSQQFKDPDMFKKVVEGSGFRIVPEYTGIASARPYFQSYCAVLEKVADAETDIDTLVAQIGKENLDGFKLKDTSVSLKNSRRIVSEFSINDQNVPVSFNAEDRGLLEEERSILSEGDALRRRYGSIQEIPREEIINRNFLKIYNGKSYRLLKKSERIGGFVDVR